MYPKIYPKIKPYIYSMKHTLMSEVTHGQYNPIQSDKNVRRYTSTYIVHSGVN